jgi:nucleotide-binding universal stress UspA family protein
MYKKILVPLDGSKVAETALPHAESLAGQYGASLILLSVITPPTLTPGPGAESLQVFETELDTLQRDTEQYLQNLRTILGKRNIQTQAVVRLEPVVGSIVAQANESAVDLVVIASHGRSGLGRVFFGSVAAGVLNRIEQPLMIIRCAGK